MKTVTYTDEEGRNWVVQLPDDVPDSDARTGIPLGPPSLEDLSLPESISVVLHNELSRRRLFTSSDIKRRRAEVIDAVRTAYKVDAEKIYVHYLKWEGKL